MKTVHAVYENGIFRPREKVDLPEHSEVEFEPRLREQSVAEKIAELRRSDPGLADVYEVLSRRFESGRHDIAQRHNEHQP